MRKLWHRSVVMVAAGLMAMGLSVASASPASAAVTPRYGMTCYTGVSYSGGWYSGYADCYTPAFAKWKVRVNCLYGFNYDSIIVYTSASNGWYRLSPGYTCYWGVNSVGVIELL